MMNQILDDAIRSPMMVLFLEISCLDNDLVTSTDYFQGILVDAVENASACF